MKILLHVSLFITRGDAVLLVQEADPEDAMRWNLPGGHVEPGESIAAAGIREALEETGLRAALTDLVGVYASIGTTEKRATRFVFRAETDHEAVAAAGEGVLAVRWFSPRDLADLPDERLLAAPTLRIIIDDGLAGTSYPLAALRER